MDSPWPITLRYMFPVASPRPLAALATPFQTSGTSNHMVDGSSQETSPGAFRPFICAKSLLVDVAIEFVSATTLTLCTLAEDCGTP